MPLQIRKGLNSLREVTTFSEGEPVWTTDTNKLYIGDGVTPGGILVAGGGGGGNTFTNITVTGTATVGVLAFNDNAYITHGNTYYEDIIIYSTSSVRINAPQGLIIGDDGAGPAISEIDVNQITGLSGGPINIPTTATIQSLIVNSVKLKAVAETVYDSGSVAAGTYTPDVTSGTVHKMLLAGNVTINALANATTGSNATLILTQDSTGTRLLSSTMKFAAGNKTLSTAATSTDIISIFYDGTIYWASLTRGFI